MKNENGKNQMTVLKSNEVLDILKPCKSNSLIRALLGYSVHDKERLLGDFSGNVKPDRPIPSEIREIIENLAVYKHFLSSKNRNNYILNLNTSFCMEPFEITQENINQRFVSSIDTLHSGLQQIIIKQIKELDSSIDDNYEGQRFKIAVLLKKLSKCGAGYSSAATIEKLNDTYQNFTQMAKVLSDIEDARSFATLALMVHLKMVYNFADVEYFLVAEDSVKTATIADVARFFCALIWSNHKFEFLGVLMEKRKHVFKLLDNISIELDPYKKSPDGKAVLTSKAMNYYFNKVSTIEPPAPPVIEKNDSPTERNDKNKRINYLRKQQSDYQCFNKAVRTVLVPMLNKHINTHFSEKLSPPELRY